MLALYAVLILAMWIFPYTIAGKLSAPVEPQTQRPATPNTLLAVGCALIGLWTLTNAVPRLVFYLYLGHSTDDRRWIATPDAVLEGVRILTAICLVLGGGRIGNMYRWAQYAGIKKDV
jgi:hypothetical protein